MKIRAAASAALAATLALAGCSVSVGNVSKVPQYVQVEAQGVTLDVVKGMVESEAPAGFDVFWQNHDGGTLVSVGVTLGADEDSYVDERLDWIGRSMDDLTTKDAGGGDVEFTGTGVDDATYSGVVGVRDGVGVMISAGEGVAAGVPGHVLDSVVVSDDVAAAGDPTEDVSEGVSEDGDEGSGDFPATTLVNAGPIVAEVLDGMESYPSDTYDGLWQTPSGVSPQVTISVDADVDASTYLQEQANAIASQMQDPVELDQTEDRFVFEGTGVDGQTYTVVVGVNGNTGVVVSSGPGLDESVLRGLADSAW